MHMEILLGSDCYIAKIEVLMSLRDDGIHCPTCAASVFFPQMKKRRPLLSRINMQKYLALVDPVFQHYCREEGR
jgi:hypothetical protein